MDSVLTQHPADPGSIPGVPKNFSEFLMLPRLIDGAAAQRSGQQGLNNNIDRTHLVLWLVASWYYKKNQAAKLPLHKLEGGPFPAAKPCDRYQDAAKDNGLSAMSSFVASFPAKLHFSTKLRVIWQKIERHDWTN